MTEDFFIKIRCSICGTQSCYGTKEDLSDCGMWNKVKYFPDDIAHNIIDYYDNKPRTNQEILNEYKDTFSKHL